MSLAALGCGRLGFEDYVKEQIGDISQADAGVDDIAQEADDGDNSGGTGTLEDGGIDNPNSGIGQGITQGGSNDGSGGSGAGLAGTTSVGLGGTASGGGLGGATSGGGPGGIMNGGSAAIPESCGDGQVDVGEDCDDGNTNTEVCVYGATSCVVCAASCNAQPGATSYCGDGATDSGNAEACDDGNTNTEVCTYGASSCVVCDASCNASSGATSYCGDGALDMAAGEECDDGNVDAGDGCDAACAEECIPADCGDLGAECGSPGNGCGADLDCGSCPAGDACSGSLSCELVDECLGAYAGAPGCESFEGGLVSWNVVLDSGTISEETSNVHSGSIAMRGEKPEGPQDGPHVTIAISPGFGSGTLYFRGYYYIETAPSTRGRLLEFEQTDDSPNININFGGDGSLDAFFTNPSPGHRVQSASGVMPNATWVCLQVSVIISNSVGQVTAAVDGVTVLSTGATKDTYPGAAITKVKVGPDWSTTGDVTAMLVDDVVIDSSPVPCH